LELQIQKHISTTKTEKLTRTISDIARKGRESRAYLNKSSHRWNSLGITPLLKNIGAGTENNKLERDFGKNSVSGTRHPRIKEVMHERNKILLTENEGL
jgi:hypothetical protein